MFLLCHQYPLPTTYYQVFPSSHHNMSLKLSARYQFRRNVKSFSWSARAEVALTSVHGVPGGGGGGVQRAVLLAVHAAQHHHSLTTPFPALAATRAARGSRADCWLLPAAPPPTHAHRARPASRRHWCASPNRRASFRTRSFFRFAFYLKRVDASAVLPGDSAPYVQ